MKITISKAIFNEYCARDVYPFVWKSGVNDLSESEAHELKADALFQSDEFGPDNPPSIKRAYAALAQKL